MPLGLRRITPRGDVYVTLVATFDLTSPWFYADPGPTLARLRELDPAAHHPGLGAVVLTRYGDVRAALADPRLEPDPREDLVGADAALAAALPFGLGDFPDRSGAWIDAALPPGRILAVRPLAEALVAERLADLEPRESPFDVMCELAQPLASGAIGALVGIPGPEMARVEAWTADLLECLGAPDLEHARLSRGRCALGSLVGSFEALLERKRRTRTADLASALSEAADGGRTPLREHALGVLGFVVGAHALSVRLVGQTLLALLTHREAYLRVGRDPSLARDAVEETLRHSGPVLCVMRRARTALVIAERPIRAGQRIACMLHAANHDPAVFAEPERFDLGRRPTLHLASGAIRGSRADDLARLLAEVAVAGLAQRMPALHLTGAAPRRGNLLLRGVTRLPVRCRPSARRGPSRLPSDRPFPASG